MRILTESEILDFPSQLSRLNIIHDNEFIESPWLQYIAHVEQFKENPLFYHVSGYETQIMALVREVERIKGSFFNFKAGIEQIIRQEINPALKLIEPRLSVKYSVEAEKLGFFMKDPFGVDTVISPSQGIMAITNVLIQLSLECLNVENVKNKYAFWYQPEMYLSESLAFYLGMAIPHWLNLYPKLNLIIGTTSTPLFYGIRVAIRKELIRPDSVRAFDVKGSSKEAKVTVVDIGKTGEDRDRPIDFFRSIENIKEFYLLK
jgi:hypothetical protein